MSWLCVFPSPETSIRAIVRDMRAKLSRVIKVLAASKQKEASIRWRVRNRIADIKTRTNRA